MNAVPVNVLLIDFYDGAQLFHWKTCESWCFLTSIVNLPPAAYRGKLGISTFAENYNNLQHVKQGLEIEVLEMICLLWEALFPDDQNSFQHHQIIDLASSIPLHGSMLYAWSEMLKNDARKILLKHARKTCMLGVNFYTTHYSISRNK